ncbi:hypothetical protein Tco_0228368 [Tanacetum coccineum]
MSWFSRCSWCGGPFNSGNCRHCTNVSFGDEPVYDSNPNSYNQTPDFSNPLPHHNYETDSRSDTGAAFQAEFAKLQQNFERFMAQQSCSYCGGPFNGGNCPSCSIVGAGNEFVHDPNPFPYDNTPDFYDQPPQHHVETYSCELCGNDSHYGYDCPPRFPLEKLHKALQAVCEKLNHQEQAANVSTHTPKPSRRFNFIYDDDDDDDDGGESTIPLNEITSQIPPSIAITPVLPIMEPEDSLNMEDEHLSTIPEKESDQVIKSSVEDLVPIPSESEDTSDNNNESDLPFCDNSVTFSNPLFDDNDDFASSDDKSLLAEDVSKENFKIYSNPLFEFDDEYISSDVNPLFNEVLEDIESEDSYVSKLDELDLLVTLLSKLNEDECFDPGGDFVLEEIEDCPTSDSIPSGIDDDDFDLEGDILLLKKLLNDDPSSPLPPKELNFEELKIIKSDVSTDFEDDYYDSKGDIIYLESLLIKDTIPNLPPEVFLDRDPRSLEDEPDKDYLKNIVKVFNPGIQMKKFSATYVKLPFEDPHYFSLTFVIRIFLPYLTYSMDSLPFLSFGSEDLIFDPGISAYSFYSLEPVAYENPMMIFPFFCICPKDKGIRGGNPYHFVEIPSGESKVHIEVLLVLWGNRLLIPDGSLPLSRFAPQLHESAGGLPKKKLVSHSCSLAGSTSAMEVSIPIAFVLPGREHECNESFKLGRPPALS